MVVGTWIERRARIAPARPALIWGDQTLTYGGLAERIRRLANGLAGLGVGRGDRVAWIGPNHPAFIETLFAVGRLGAVLAPVNHNLATQDRAGVLDDTEPTVVVEYRSTSPTRLPASVRHRLVVEGEGGIAYNAFITDSSADDLDATVDPDDLLFLPHTSGTTGRPKGVMLSHGNVTWNVLNLLSRADFRGDDVTPAIAPFFRVGGTGVNVLPVLFLGGTLVVPESVTGGAILDLIERHRVTVGFGNPDTLDAMVRADRWPSVDLSSVRFIITGGAPVPERLIRTFHDRGVALIQGYGLSEAAPFVLLLDAERAIRKVGAAGSPAMFTDVRIVDRDGRDAEPGTTGELAVRGPNVMTGYWRRPDATAEVLRDGWLHTGDAGRIDDEGDVWIVDRVDAAYVSDGWTVYPGDVERVLMAHPYVADAGVVGLRTPDGSVTGSAFVVRDAARELTEADVLAFAREHLAPHEVPSSITFVEVLPRSSVGKLLRQELRAT